MWHYVFLRLDEKIWRGATRLDVENDSLDSDGELRNMRGRILQAMENTSLESLICRR